jgi:hypothetical protein
MGWVTADEVATMLPDAAFATHALPDVGRADFQAREPGGALREALERGQFAWQKLRRRKPFADLDARVERVPALEEGTMHASHLAGALASLHGRIDEAVGVRRDADGFAAEFETFANALADIHGFERGGHRP